MARENRDVLLAAPYHHPSSLPHDAWHHGAEGQLLVDADELVVSHVEVLVPGQTRAHTHMHRGQGRRVSELVMSGRYTPGTQHMHMGGTGNTGERAGD